MVREDDAVGGQKKQKSAGLGPTTLDLSATEVAGETQPTSAEASAESVISSPSGSVAEPSVELAQEAEAPRQDRPAAEKPAVEERVTEDLPRRSEAPVQPQSSRSGLPLALATLAGGIIGGGLVLAAISFGLVSLGPNGEGESLAPRLAVAEQGIAANKTALAQALDGIGTAKVAAKTAQDAASNALAVAGEARKAASAAGTAGSGAPAGAPDLSGITDRLGKTEAEVAGFTDRLTKAETDVATLNDAMGKVGTATGSLSQQIAALKTAAANTPDKAAAYAVALSQLGEAVRSGKPFAAELKTAGALGGDEAALAPLASFADTGTPSVEALAASYEAVKPQIVAALTPKPAEPPADASVLDRLTSSLSSVVTTTPDGDVPPTDPAYPAQKVADALRRGDLAGAIDAFKAIPEPARQAGAAWLSQASGAATAFDLIKAQTSAALQKFTGQ
jgi:hypothetical protein